MQCDSHGVNIIAGKSSVGEESLKKKKKAFLKCPVY